MLTHSKRILLLLLPFMMFACQKQVKTPEFFLLHPEYIQPTYDQCVTSKSTSDKHSMECVAVMMVIPIFKQYLSELMSNSPMYGLKIMQAQIRLVELQKKLVAIENQMNETTSNSDEYQTLQKQQEQLKEAINRQELLVKSRQAVLRVIHKGS